MSVMGTRGVLFSIQRFSVHDGPGIRTTAFLKGCPLSCRWCQNPEGLTREIGVWHFANLCVNCGRCQATCRKGALTTAANGDITADPILCTRCGDCIGACNHNALAFDSFEMDAATLAEELEADRVFFTASGGGVTFSGGEPYAQAAFMTDAAARLKKRNIHVAVETSLQGEWAEIETSLEVINLFIVDLKLLNPVRHRNAAGVDNKLILENFRRLAACLAGTGRLLIRTPMIPHYTAEEVNIRELARFIGKNAPGAAWEFMNFNPLAAAKYRRMHLPKGVFANDWREFSPEAMRQFRIWAAEEGLAAR